MQEENIERPEEIQEAGSMYQPETKQAGPEIVAVKPSFFVFNSNTLLGLALLAGLIVLYFLHFKASAPAGLPAPVLMQASSGKQPSIVFVNLDSLNVHYDYVKVLKRDLESTGKRLQTEVLSEQAALEKEAADFQRQMSANSIPEDKAKVIYEQLMQKQQALMQKKERYTQQVADQEMGMNLRLVDSVTVFLKRFNRQYHFDYIMGYKAGGEILVGNDTLDITHSVLEQLNSEYAKRRK